MSSILIIGGGVIGLCTAHCLARRGHKVTVVDRGAESHGGCTLGNAGLIVPSHFIPLAAPGAVALGLKWMWNRESPFWVKPRFDKDLFSWGMKFWKASTTKHVEASAPLLRDLNMASRECFEEFEAVPGNSFGLAKHGLLILCQTEHAFDEEAKSAEQARKLGLPAEVLSKTEARDLDPGITMEIAGAVFFPKDCHLIPGLFLERLKFQAGKAGVRFAWNTEVMGWRVENGGIAAIKTVRGDFAADEYVLCGGSWSPSLATDLGLKLPMQAGKGYSLTLPNPRQLPKIPSILAEARVAVTPMGSALRFAGTMEIAGLNNDISPIRVRGIINAAARYFPEFGPKDFEGIEPWRGLRPCSPDGLPYVGRTRQYRNLSIATGHAMMGLSLAPITGRLMAEIISGEQPSIEIHQLDPDRYG